MAIETFIPALKKHCPWLTDCGGGKLWAKTPTRAIAFYVDTHDVYVEYMGDFEKLMMKVVDLCMDHHMDMEIIPHQHTDKSLIFKPEFHPATPKSS